MKFGKVFRPRQTVVSAFEKFDRDVIVQHCSGDLRGFFPADAGILHTMQQMQRAKNF